MMTVSTNDPAPNKHVFTLYKNGQYAAEYEYSGAMALAATDVMLLAATNGVSALTAICDCHIDGIVFVPEVLTDAAVKLIYEGSSVAYGFVRHPVLCKSQQVETEQVPQGLSEFTTRWAESSWSPRMGYPACGSFFQERSMRSGADKNPQTIWGSVSGDYENYRMGSMADDGVKYLLSSEQINRILWLFGHKKLMIGTEGDEWTLSGEGNKPISAEEAPDAQMHTNHGSASRQAFLVNSAMLFLEAGGRKLREFAYVFEHDRFDASDLTILTEAITASGIKGMAYQFAPYSILWCWRNDGKVAVMVYERSHDVVGWGIIFTDGDIESMDVMPGAGGNDEVWAAVRRTIDGADVRTIERFKPIDIAGAIEDAFYVDGGLDWHGGQTAHITNIAVNGGNGQITVTLDALPVDSTGQALSWYHKVRLSGVGGMVELNGQVFTVYNLTGTSFVLRNEANTAYVDGRTYAAYTGGGQAARVSKVFSGLSHLNGKTVTALVDGVVQPDMAVAGGNVTLTGYVERAVIGLKYSSVLQPMKLSGQSATGTGRGKTKQVGGLSFSCQFGPSEAKLDTLAVASGELYTGEKRTSFAGGFEKAGDIIVKSDLPLPLVLRAIYPEYEVYEI
jgi:hypothetical protein